MSYTTVFCIAISQAQADYIIDQLREAKFPNRDISVLLADYGYSQWTHPLAPADDDDGAWGWIAGIGVLPVPEVGPFMAAGPILVALCGSPGVTAGTGISGGLYGLGLRANQSQRLESRIRDGNILISVHTAGPRQFAQAKGIFTQAGAHEICCADASDTPPVRVAPTRASRHARYSIHFLS